MGACDCTLSEDALGYLANLNVRLAGLYHDCPCGGPNLDDATRALFLEVVSRELEDLRIGKMELCQGYTGSDFPAAEYVQYSWTGWNAAGIMMDTILRSRS